MRNLIKKILFEEFFQPRITIEEISYDEIKDYLILLEGETTLPPREEDVTDTLKIIDNVYDESYKEGGEDYDVIIEKDDNGNKVTPHDKAIKLEIEPTEHWYSRLRRKEEPKYSADTQIQNPTVIECMNMILNKKTLEFFIRKIKNFKWSGNNVITLKLIKDEGTKNELTQIVLIEKIRKYQNVFKLILITNFKGKKFINSDYDKSQKLIVKEIKKRIRNFLTL